MGPIHEVVTGVHTLQNGHRTLYYFCQVGNSSMGRNIVICCDGTGNTFDSINTNVVRIAQVIARDPSKQLLYYDPGLGTLPEPRLLK